jgi:hypothetical protein
VPFPSNRAARALCVTLVLLASPLVRANNVVGAWDPTLYSWPLIPVHAALTPDMRVMTYGTDGIARQTGFFIYDIWDINSGLSGGHLTLDNVTNTDIFCSSQIVLPQGGQVFLGGGDNWTGTSTTNTGNKNTTVLDLSSNVLSRANDMNLRRWYAGSTVLLNGEVYIQGGSGGGQNNPEVRQLDGTFRLLSAADADGDERRPEHHGNGGAANPKGTGDRSGGEKYPVHLV